MIDYIDGNRVEYAIRDLCMPIRKTYNSCIMSDDEFDEWCGKKAFEIVKDLHGILYRRNRYHFLYELLEERWKQRHGNHFFSDALTLAENQYQNVGEKKFLIYFQDFVWQWCREYKELWDRIEEKFSNFINDLDYQFYLDILEATSSHEPYYRD